MQTWPTCARSVKSRARGSRRRVARRPSVWAVVRGWVRILLVWDIARAMRLP